ncbi:MAG: ABC transporter permease [Gemmatimonadetes bacterium]|nr:ABC transporter permease [Gemmatimonadota bacterium]
MRILEGIRIALQQIWAHKLKSAFTLIGVIIGITFLIAVITIVEGVNRYVQDDFAGALFGVNTFTVVRRSQVSTGPESEERRRRQARNPYLTMHDVEVVRNAVANAWRFSYSVDRGFNQVSYNERSRKNIRVIGGSRGYETMQGWDIAEGRGLSPLDERKSLKVAVIGADIAERLFPDLSPIGKRIRLGANRLEVVGVWEKQGGLLGVIRDASVLVPISTYRQTMAWRRDRVEEIQVKMRSTEEMEGAMLEVEAALRRDRKLRPDVENSFWLQTSSDLLGAWEKINRILFVALPGLVSISLVVGGIVIMNIMLLSVAGRIKEIGIRKALGARRRDILLQFLAESSTLSVAGAAVGIGLGIAMGKTVDALTPVPASVPMWAIVVSLLLGLLVGVGSGIYPAYRAAQQDPIVALRYE